MVQVMLMLSTILPILHMGGFGVTIFPLLMGIHSCRLMEWTSIGGPFDNGEIIGGLWLGHEYTIVYMGDGSPITFAIVDWIDMDFTNNWCHLRVTICEEGEVTGHSPGWWKYNFKAHINPKGNQKPHVSWSAILMWTADIDAAARILPTPWDLPLLADIDYDSDGFFATDDAYNIFTTKIKAWKMMWLSVANWYNWAAGFGQYMND
jgi:hypothetical protein